MALPRTDPAPWPAIEKTVATPIDEPAHFNEAVYRQR